MLACNSVHEACFFHTLHGFCCGCKPCMVTAHGGGAWDATATQAGTLFSQDKQNADILAQEQYNIIQH